MALQRGQNKASRAFVAIGIALVVGLIAFFAYRARTDHAQSAVAVSEHSEPILIPGIQEPEEMRVEPMPAAVLTPPERMLGDAMQQAGNKGGPNAMRPALDRILAKYPDYSDGYVMRLGSLCEGSDRVAILSDVNSALKYVSDSRVGKNSTGSLLSMRAKVEHSNVMMRPPWKTSTRLSMPISVMPFSSSTAGP
jgi:hypothetical protein